MHRSTFIILAGCVGTTEAPLISSPPPTEVVPTVELDPVVEGSVTSPDTDLWTSLVLHIPGTSEDYLTLEGVGAAPVTAGAWTVDLVDSATDLGLEFANVPLFDDTDGGGLAYRFVPVLFRDSDGNGAWNYADEVLDARVDRILLFVTEAPDRAGWAEGWVWWDASTDTQFPLDTPVDLTPRWNAPTDLTFTASWDGTPTADLRLRGTWATAVRESLDVPPAFDIPFDGQGRVTVVLDGPPVDHPGYPLDGLVPGTLLSYAQVVPRVYIDGNGNGVLDAGEERGRASLCVGGVPVAPVYVERPSEMSHWNTLHTWDQGPGWSLTDADGPVLPPSRPTGAPIASDACGFIDPA